MSTVLHGRCFNFADGLKASSFLHVTPCNHGTADHDLLVAMLARMDPFDDTSDKDGKHVDGDG